MGRLKAAPSSSNSGTTIRFPSSGSGGISYSGINLGGGGGNLSVTPAPATSSSSTRTTGSTAKTGTQQQSTSGVQRTNNVKTRDLQLLDDESMQVLQDALAQMAGGGSPLLAAIDQARQGSITNTQNLIAGADVDSAVARAGGRTADLSRQLQEEAIASLLGSNEAGGFGGNALSQLRAQDAAVRTAEAQARVEEEAANTAISQQLAGTEALNQVLAGGSAVQDQLVQLLNVAKGAVEQGTEVDQGVTTTDELSNTVYSEQGTADQTQNTNTTAIDPLEWAKLAAQLDLTNAEGPSATEKALALFPALGGNSSALLASLSKTPGLYSTQGQGNILGAGDQFKELVSLLGGR